MPKHFYGLYSQTTSYGPDPGTKTGQVGYYKYVEDANYHAGKLFERCLTREWIGKDKVWQKIADCGATPFVHTISCETTSGTVYYTIIVREETLHEDVDDISTGLPLHTITCSTKTRRDASKCGVQGPGFQPAFGNRSHPPAIPTPTTTKTYNPTIENENLRDHNSPNPQWLLCQPAFSTNPASKLSGSIQSRSEVSTSELSDSEISDSEISDSLASILGISLSDPKPLPNHDQHTGIPVNEINDCMNDVYFSCLEFNDETLTYYNTGCSACLQTPTTSTSTITEPENYASVSASTVSPNNQLLSELLYYNN